MGYLYDAAKKGNRTFSDIMAFVNDKTKHEKLLKSAVFQLTPLCNLKCKMCYARLEPKEVSNSGRRLLSFNEWKYYIDCVAQMGVFSLSFTGGECTLHPDFIKIYSYAYDKGISVGVMTNCTNITDEIFELFVKKPPIGIDMTFYGSSPETYEKLCGNRNAYYKVYENFEKLVNAGFNINAKYTFTKDNIDDYEAVEQYCTDKKVPLLLSNELLNLDRCDSKTIDEVDTDTDVRRELLFKVFSKKRGITVEQAKKESAENFWEQCKDKAVNPEKNFYTGCSAARNSLHITWEGLMTPCVSFLAFAEDPRKIGFVNCWKKMNDWIENMPVLTECLECPFVTKCLTCVAAHYNDTGEFNKVSPRLCWKLQHPEEAAEIMKRLEQEGLIKKDEQQ